jgi:hypothetical protein
MGYSVFPYDRVPKLTQNFTSQNAICLPNENDGKTNSDSIPKIASA